MSLQAAIRVRSRIDIWAAGLAAAVRAVAGWRRRGLLWALGVGAAATLPPVHVFPLLFVAFTGLLWLMDPLPASPAGRRAAFGAGWWFGFGFFTAGFYWMAYPMLVEPERFAWVIPFAVLALPAFLAVFSGLTTLIVAVSGATGVLRVLLLALVWSALEWVRGWILTGFPWNLIGSAWSFSDAMLQVVALVGAFGLSLITVAACAMPATLGGADNRRAWPLVGAGVAVLLVIWAGGTIRIATAMPGDVPGVNLRLVQANIPQRYKWNRELREVHFAEQLRMSKLSAGGNVATHIVWPETATPFFIDRDVERLQRLAGTFRDGGALITGAPRTSALQEQPFRLWNSLHVVDGGGAIAATYDKSHLVPFGEYIPVRGLFGSLDINIGGHDFSPGDGIRTIRVPGAPPASPLICYEVIFPGKVVGDGGPRPEWLLNLTNDAWFGPSSGPYQHLASARMRAVEEGLPLVRSANTGISAVIGPYGRILASLGLNEKGIVDSPLPAKLAGQTVFARFGNWTFFTLWAAAALAATVLRITQSRQNPA